MEAQLSPARHSSIAARPRGLAVRAVIALGTAAPGILAAAPAALARHAPAFVAHHPEVIALLAVLRHL
jgi:hypothetical protein